MNITISSRNGSTVSLWASTSATTIKFVNCQDITISGLKFIAGGGFLNFINTSDGLSIKGCSFVVESSLSSPITSMVILENVTDNVHICLTNLTSLYAQGNSMCMLIEDSTFTNSNTTALTINIDKDATDNDIVLRNCHFHNNWVHMTVSIRAAHNSIAIIGTVFSEGALHIDINTPGVAIATNTIKFTSCEFCNHNSHSAVIEYDQHDIYDAISMSFVRCNFSNNTGEVVSTVNAQVSPKNIYVGKVRTILIFENCYWTNNYIRNNGPGATIRTEVPVKFCGNNVISSSHYQTSLAVMGTIVYFEGNFTISRGGPVLFGGGIYLTSSSVLRLLRDVVMIINDTKAQYGGGIYRDSLLPYSGLSNNDTCIFDFDNDSNPEIYFNNTSASISGDAIFLKKFCIIPYNLFPNLNRTKVDEMNSSPYTFKVTMADSNAVILGQPLAFNIVSKNTIGKPTVTIATASLDCLSVKTNQATVFAFTNGTDFHTDLRLLGPSNASDICPENCRLTMYTSSQPFITTTLYVNITQCPLGYTYNEDDQHCVCINSVSEITCVKRFGKVCIKEGYWYGYVGRDDNDNDLYSAEFCSSNQCKKCSTDSPICSSGFCLLPPKEEDQCENGYAGPYCSICSLDAVLGYEGILCIPRAQCHAWSKVLLVTLYVIFWVTIIVLFIGLLKLGLHIRCDYLYSYIYYFGAVPNVLKSIHQPVLEGYVNIISGMIQLNPRFLGYLPLCFIPHLSHIQYAALSYINPFLMIATLLITTQLAKRYKMFYLSKNSSLYGLCTVLLLTFASLNEASLAILRPIVLSKKAFVFTQPNITYFDCTHHLPYAIMAILIEVFFLIPFTFLLLFSPCLSRWINFVRIKPILDNFQSCFHDNMRGMGGFYFLGRLIFMFVSLMQPHSPYKESTNILIAVLMLFVITILQPYKNKALNYLDGFMLLNLVVLQILVFYSWDSQDKGLYYSSIVVIYILILLASLYGAVLLVVCSLLLLWKRGRCWYMKPEALRELMTQLKDKYLMKKSYEPISMDGILLTKKYDGSKYRDSVLGLLHDDDDDNRSISGTPTKLQMRRWKALETVDEEDARHSLPTSSVVSITY